MTLSCNCKVVGIKPYSGVIRETGEAYSGKHLYITLQEPGVTGVATDIQKVSDKVPGAKSIVVGNDYTLTFEATEYNGESRLKVSNIQPLNK